MQWLAIKIKAGRPGRRQYLYVATKYDPGLASKLLYCSQVEDISIVTAKNKKEARIATKQYYEQRHKRARKPNLFLKSSSNGYLYNVLKNEIENAMKRNNGSQLHASLELGISRRQINYWLNKLDLNQWRPKAGKKGTYV